MEECRDIAGTAAADWAMAAATDVFTAGHNLSVFVPSRGRARLYEPVGEPVAPLRVHYLRCFSNLFVVICPRTPKQIPFHISGIFGCLCNPYAIFIVVKRQARMVQGLKTANMSFNCVWHYWSEQGRH